MGIGAALDADGDYGASVDYWGLGILTCEVFVGLETSALRASGASEANPKPNLIPKPSPCPKPSPSPSPSPNQNAKPNP